MSFVLVVEPSAKLDIAYGHAYYAQFDKADAFLAAIDHAFERISDQARQFPVLYLDVRRALLRRFPFSVFFIIEGDRVVVLAVHHQHRDPASRPEP